MQGAGASMDRRQLHAVCDSRAPCRPPFEPSTLANSAKSARAGLKNPRRDPLPQDLTGFRVRTYPLPATPFDLPLLPLRDVVVFPTW